MMQESFLHFVWQHQYFDKTGLCASDGQPVNIIRPGFHNMNSGPDFGEATIKIGELDWRGSVEIHSRSSDWNVHGHTKDKAYDNVILHVVWEDDAQVLRNDGTEIPTLTLSDRVDPALVKKYRQLINHTSDIPCEGYIRQVNELLIQSMLDSTAMERLYQKSEEAGMLSERNGNDWEETTYQLFCKNFGFKTNADQFMRLAELVPFRILKKHSNNLQQIEALLFGQAGFLEEGSRDAYSNELLKEFTFLHHKYQLKEPLSRHQWKFMRLRPANFPTLRIAQLAGILSDPSGLFSRAVEVKSKKQLLHIFKKGVGNYWKMHYQFGREATADVSLIGAGSIENIGINTVAPVLIAYGKSIDDQGYVDQAVALLQELATENNKITRTLKKCGIVTRTAFESQGAIQLYNHYCLKKRCLSCKIGVDIIRRP